MSTKRYHSILTIMIDHETSDPVGLVNYDPDEDTFVLEDAIRVAGGEESFKVEAMKMAERAIDCVLRQKRREL